MSKTPEQIAADICYAKNLENEITGHHFRSLQDAISAAIREAERRGMAKAIQLDEDAQKYIQTLPSGTPGIDHMPIGGVHYGHPNINALAGPDTAHERSRVKALLQVSMLKDALELYADRSNWVHHQMDRDSTFVARDNEFDEKTGLYTGGKRARDVLARLQGK